MLALTDEITNHQPQNPLELIDTHAKQVKLFNQVADNFIAERERRFKRKQQHIDHLKDDILHRWEVKGLHGKFGAILNVDPQVDLIFIVVLNPKNQTETTQLFLSVFLEHVDEIIEDVMWERLNVFDNECDWCSHSGKICARQYI